MEAMVTKSNNDIGPAKDKKVLIFVVCYKAADSIESVLDRIPTDIWNNERFDAEVLVIDNQSPDRTFYAA